MSNNTTTNHNSAVQYYQQGDVLLKRVAALPEGLEKFDGEKALQHGETTGHMHRFDAGAAVDLFVRPEAERVFLNNGNTIVPGIGKFLIVREPSALSHEEHRTLTIAPGIYEMDLVREYDYDSQEVRWVVD